MTLSPIIESGLSPELTGNLNGVDAGGLPPGLLVAGEMDRPVMRAAERDGEFIARFAAQGARLCKPEMMRVGGLAAANQARLPGDGAQVLTVSVAAGCGDRKVAFVYRS